MEKEKDEDHLQDQMQSGGPGHLSLDPWFVLFDIHELRQQHKGCDEYGNQADAND